MDISFQKRHNFPRGLVIQQACYYYVIHRQEQKRVTLNLASISSDLLPIKTKIPSDTHIFPERYVHSSRVNPFIIVC